MEKRKILKISAYILSGIIVLLLSCSMKAFNNRAITFSSGIVFSLICLLVAWMNIKPSSDNVWGTAARSGLICSILIPFISFWTVLICPDNHTLTSESGLMFFYFIIISIILFLFFMLIFLSYGSLIYYIKTKKTWSLILFIIGGLVILAGLVFAVSQIIDEYDVDECGLSYGFGGGIGSSYADCMNKKCGMFPRNQKACLEKYAPQLLPTTYTFTKK